MIISFTIPGNPVAKGRPRFARRGKFISTYTPKKTQTYEDIVRWHALEARGDTPLFDGVSLSLFVHCFIGIPASWSKKKREQARIGVLDPLGRPDADNALKLVQDALNGVLYRDDGAICIATVTKKYSENPRTEVTLISS